MIMKNRTPFLVFIGLFFISSLGLRAQEKSLEELLSLGMNDLLNLKIVSVLKKSGNDQ